MNPNNIFLTLPLPNYHQPQLLHLTHKQNEDKIVHMILPHVQNKNSDKTLLLILQKNKHLKEKNIQSSTIQSQIIYLTLTKVDACPPQITPYETIEMMQKILNLIMDFSAFNKGLILFNNCQKQFFFYQMDFDVHPIQNQDQKIKIWALITFSFLSSRSLSEYLNKVKQYVWAKEHPGVKNDGSNRIQESVMIMLKSAIKNQIPTFSILNHTIEIIKQRMDWRKELQTNNYKPPPKYLKVKGKEKMGKKGRTAKEEGDRSKKLRHSFSMTAFSTSSIGKYTRSKNSLMKINKQIKKQNCCLKQKQEWFSNNKTVQSFYQTSSFSTEAIQFQKKKQNQITNNESFRNGVNDEKIKILKQKLQKQSEKKNETFEIIQRNEVEKLIKQNSMSLCSNVFEFSSGRKRNLKLSSMIYFMSERMTDKQKEKQQTNNANEVPSVNSTSGKSLSQKREKEVGKQHILNNINFFRDILQYFNNVLKKQRNKYCFVHYVYYINYILIRNLYTKKDELQLIKSLQTLRKNIHSHKKNQQFILSFDCSKWLEEGKAADGLTFIRNDSLSVLVMHFRDLADFLCANKSELIQKGILKGYLKYLAMVVIGIEIIKKPVEKMHFLKDFESYVQGIEKAEPMLLDVRQKKKELEMVLQNIIKG